LNPFLQLSSYGSCVLYQEIILEQTFYLSSENPNGLIYQPIYKHRIVWYGGESTMLRFQILYIDKGWRVVKCQPFMHFPAGVKEFLKACEDFYQSCLEEHGLNKN
jgi:hypothetical protein